MYRRLDEVSAELDLLGLTHRSSYLPMLARLAQGDPVEPLKTLADVLEPSTFGQRIRAHRYTQLTLLNRLVDAVRPESETAREFAALVDGIDRVQMRNWLIRWRDNDAQLQPLLPKSELTKELAPVSTNLHLVSQAGLDAIGYLREHHNAPPAWKTREVAFLKQSEKPQAVLLNMVAPAVLKLVQATTTP